MMTDTPTFLTERKKFSQEKLTSFEELLNEQDSLKELKNLCIYVTGSYGRLEASQFSDIDLFFLEDPTNGDKSSRIQEILVNADIVRLARKLNYPEFSGDGEYLKILQVKDILDNLGGQNEDYENYFTARLLLLLESRAIWNKNVHKRVVKKIVKSYYRDYERHEKDFQPTFIINDIIRFWKTLCLNYENKRNKTGSSETEQAKHHLKNLKLKFSRLTICFSAIIWLGAIDRTLNEDEIVKMVELTPLERLQEVGEIFAGNKEVIKRLEKMSSEYEWFLEKMNVPSEESRQWINIEANRKEASRRGREYGQEVYLLLQAVTANKNFLRYVVV